MNDVNILEVSKHFQEVFSGTFSLVQSHSYSPVVLYREMCSSVFTIQWTVHIQTEKFSSTPYPNQLSAGPDEIKEFIIFFVCLRRKRASLHVNSGPGGSDRSRM